MEKLPDNHATAAAILKLEPPGPYYHRGGLFRETPASTRFWAGIINGWIARASSRRQHGRRRDPKEVDGVRLELLNCRERDFFTSNRVFCLRLPLGPGEGYLLVYVGAPPHSLGVSGWGDLFANASACPACRTRQIEAKLESERKQRRDARRVRGWAPIDINGPLVCIVEYPYAKTARRAT